MELDIDALSREVGKAHHLSIEIDGFWVASYEFDATVELSDVEAIIKDEIEIAVEVFYVSDTGATSIVGVRVNPPEFDKKRKAQIILRTFEAVRDDIWPTLAAVVAGFRSIIDSSLFPRQIDAVEVGVIDLWKTVGSVSLWQKGEPLPTVESVDRKLNEHPPIFGTFPEPNPVGIEQSYSTPMPHWITTQVSTSTPEGHRLEIDMVNRAACG